MSALNENPLMILIYVGISVFMLRMYFGDVRADVRGQPNPRAMPGAKQAAPWVFGLGLIGALILLAIETGGEIALGIADEQSEMVWYFVFAALGAGIIEEVFFRGFLVVENKGRTALISSCVIFSLIFALIHGHLWSTEEAFVWTFTSKGCFTTLLLFANSLWFYALRFGPWNPTRSIFPCMLAHAASNLGVFLVKWSQGFIIF